MIEAIQFSSFSEFLDMGGYAFNVWSVYGLFALFILVNLLYPVQKRKAIIREQKRRLMFEDDTSGMTENSELSVSGENE